MSLSVVNGKNTTHNLFNQQSKFKPGLYKTRRVTSTICKSIVPVSERMTSGRAWHVKMVGLSKKGNLKCMPFKIKQTKLLKII
jgi:hypothetical protein